MKLKRLHVNPTDVIVKNNFREHFDIEDLKQNMAANGLLQPIVITIDKELVAGERRLRAARELGWEKIDCVVRDFETDTAQTAAGIFENMKRESYTKSEEMKALAWLDEHWKESGKVTTKADTGRGKKKDSGSLSFAEKVAKETNQSVSAVKEKTRIGKRMTSKVAKAIDKGEITQKQAEQIVRLENSEEQDAVLEQAKGKPLEVTKLLVAREIGFEDTEATKYTNKLLADLKRYGNGLGRTLVRIVNDDIVFHGLQKLEALHIVASVDVRLKSYREHRDKTEIDVTPKDIPHFVVAVEE